MDDQETCFYVENFCEKILDHLRFVLYTYKVFQI